MAVHWQAKGDVAVYWWTQGDVAVHWWTKVNVALHWWTRDDVAVHWWTKGDVAVHCWTTGDVAVHLKNAWLQGDKRINSQGNSTSSLGNSNLPIQATATASLYESGALVKADCA